MQRAIVSIIVGSNVIFEINFFVVVLPISLLLYFNAVVGLAKSTDFANIYIFAMAEIIFSKFIPYIGIMMLAFCFDFNFNSIQLITIHTEMNPWIFILN